ncbi:MAG: arginine--tRNA ligase [Alphaproteobacteria bacterium]|jgi:arginyl-tRNA synthetase|nr:arginine--tRNA ligase [Alphaproteobacteria bacterium]MDP6254225.1 arginine--tRNA ligase [Alphaproteobacteria bacterium]MDP7052697.1 arginine--tRNA ligase [Alphaproteobacteria bacterium]MDP7229815.1 arginine--tRNA ligase [Alphaproteobacteria bacterium]MDP7461003.1 arginine--tRNA ligase [Alphaproteobacteria bacterium]|tara:strand:+ start:3801 stop:5552 length:1752 start_codon:yes stop_codon:yes gene_type:complete
MNPYAYIREQVVTTVGALADDGVLPAGMDFANLAVETPRDPSHGDVATNAALVLTKQAKMKPRDIATPLAERLANLEVVEAAEIAGPGFINLRLSDNFWRQRLVEVLVAGNAYGDSQLAGGEKINVEYVSANPTGPLHIGHVRGAVYGDALATLLAKVGYDVCKEYYINDAGAQVDVLARSVHLRYREALGEDVGEISEGMYPGDYLIPVGQDIAKRDGDKWRDLAEADWLSEFRRLSVDAMMDLVRADLASLGIEQEVFFSEESLHRDGGIDSALATLQEKDLIYTDVLDPPKGKTPDDWEPRPQTLFKASQFDDDVDRPLQKSDGAWTYFAADIAYHHDKLERGYKQMVDVWGADHGGYIKRMNAAVRALSNDQGHLDVRLCQMVRLLRGGEVVRMSKRAGNFVTLRELVDEVGRDVVRFMMLTRKNDAPLDFDFEVAMEQSKDNPVFYVQYAHARIHSVLRRVGDELPDLAFDPESLAKSDLGLLTDSAEMDLIKQMATWPRAVEIAAQAREPHRIAFYLNELASDFHSLWNKGNAEPGLRFIMEEDAGTTQARLALIQGVAFVLASGLGIMGVEPVDAM